MIATVIEHLAVASMGIAALVLLALLLRSIMRNDAVAAHRMLVAFLPAILLALPFQAALTEFAPDWAREYWRNASDARGGSAWVSWLRAVDDPAPATTLYTADQTLRDVAIEPSGGHRTLSSAGVLRAMLAVYLVGVVAAIATWIARFRGACRILRRCSAVIDPHVLGVWRDAVASLNVSPAIRLLQCDGLPAPACWGWRHPAVLVPAPPRPDALGEHSLRCALLHELFHLTRRD